ncbi:MAG TPA: O-antigen ligase family protein [Opitutus sp.]|nr:O-antigen ligase family protein [Opitutus sp.]
MRPARVETLLIRTLVVVALAGLAILTLIDRGPTRLYATPWVWLLWLVEALPLVLLVLRGFSHAAPLALPPRPWLLVAAGFSAVVLASASLSPFPRPSLLWALMPLAGAAAFFLLSDWLQSEPSPRPPAVGSRGDQLLTAVGLFAAVVIALSLGEWLARDLLPAGVLWKFSALAAHRNNFPFGHSNYAAGFALLAISPLAALAIRRRGLRRAAWALATLLAIALLFSSGSRGGAIGFAALIVAALVQSGLGWKKLLLITAAGLALALTFAFIHPRTRALLLPHAAVPAKYMLDASNRQRSAMATGGLLIGADRPVLGWGPGSTPLIYPRYRSRLDGGVEDAFQLHCTPIQLWADLGGAGVLCLAAFLWLAARAALQRENPRGGATIVAATALAGYGTFALTDYQLDFPIFTFALALCAAVLASDQCHVLRDTSRRLAEEKCHVIRDTFHPRLRSCIGNAALLTLAIVIVFARRDPAPALNIRALALARSPAGADRAVALLRESLALNPDQEIAHFNLGWLLVTRDPADAELHFLAAAHLVPDKGGVYFGLALARLNQKREGDAARAFALACLNNPLFLTSPWWRQPEIARLRLATITDLHHFADRAAARLDSRRDPRARDARYVAALADWLDGRGVPGEILARSLTPERVRFFASRPALPDFASAPIRVYHRERTGYPVLMRDLDLPPPIDVFEIQENSLAVEKFDFLFPAKGWLPAPVLIALLDSPPPKS